MIDYQKELAVSSLCKSVFLLVFMLFVVSLTNAQLKLQPLVGFGTQKMGYDYGNINVKGSGGLNIGADLFYYLNDNIAVGAGVRFSTYKTTATADSATISSSGNVDKDEDTYTGMLTLKDFSEKNSLSSIEIPLLGRYQKWVGPDFIVFGTTGPVFIIPGACKTDLESATVSSSGLLEDYGGVLLDEASEYGYYNDSIMSGTSFDNNAKFSLAWDIEVGAEYYLNSRINLSLTAFYQPGLTNFIGSSDMSAGTFTGTLSGAGSAKLSKLGIRFGLTIDLTPPEKSSVKSIR